MNIIDMLDAIVDLIYEIVTEMLNDARRRIKSQPRQPRQPLPQRPTKNSEKTVPRWTDGVPYEAYYYL